MQNSIDQYVGTQAVLDYELEGARKKLEGGFFAQLLSLFKGKPRERTTAQQGKEIRITPRRLTPRAGRDKLETEGTERDRYAQNDGLEIERIALFAAFYSISPARGLRWSERSGSITSVLASHARGWNCVISFYPWPMGACPARAGMKHPP
jgi:hypothetical protein